MRVLLVIDLPPAARYHRATVEALGHAAAALGAPLDLRVVASDAADLGEVRDGVEGVVIGPGSPYPRGGRLGCRPHRSRARHTVGRHVRRVPARAGRARP